MPTSTGSNAGRDAQKEAHARAVSGTPHSDSKAVIALAVLGIVYGDIGTSPIYALRECFFGHNRDCGVAAERAGHPVADVLDADAGRPRQQQPSFFLPGAVDPAGDGRDLHRLAGGDHGRLIADAPSRPAWPAAAAAGGADVGSGTRADLHGLGQLDRPVRLSADPDRPATVQAADDPAYWRGAAGPADSGDHPLAGTFPGPDREAAIATGSRYCGVLHGPHRTDAASAATACNSHRRAARKEHPADRRRRTFAAGRGEGAIRTDQSRSGLLPRRFAFRFLAAPQRAFRPWRIAKQWNGATGSTRSAILSAM